MHLIRLLLLAFLVLTLSQCKKKTYPESVVVNEPEFYADLTSAGGSVLMQAGTNNYRVYSSYVQASSGLYTYVSEFKPQGCSSNCLNSIRFEINDSKISSSGAASDINAAIFPGNFEYTSPNWAVQFESNYNNTASTYRWNFGDGTESFEINPKHVYKKGGTYSVCLTITSTNGCESSICNQVEIGYPADNCSVQVTSTTGAFNAVQFTASATGQAPFIYEWSFGDGTDSIGTQSQPNHFYAIRGAYQARVRVTDAKKDVAVFNYNVVTSGDSSSCASNMAMTSITQSADSILLSKVLIRYTDVKGEHYTSNQYALDSDQKFEIVSVEDYENNERGEATKKLKVRFTANLYNGLKQLKFKDSEAVICISYKK